eukprot:s550_g1.t7
MGKVLRQCNYADDEQPYVLVNRYVFAKFSWFVMMMEPLHHVKRRLLHLQTTLYCLCAQLFIPDSNKQSTALTLHRLRRRFVHILLQVRPHFSWTLPAMRRRWHFLGHVLRKPANSIQLLLVSGGMFQMHKMTVAGPWNTLYSWLTDVLLYLGWGGYLCLCLAYRGLQLLRELAADRDTWRSAWDMNVSRMFVEPFVYEHSYAWSNVKHSFNANAPWLIVALLMACEQHGHDQEERRVLSGLADALPEEVAVLLRKTSAGLLSSAQLNIPTVAITRASSSYRKELSLLRRALHVEPNSPDAVLEAMVDFGQELGEAGAWAKFAGGSKAQSLLAALRGAAPSRTAGPPEVLEIGTYCSYSAISIVTASSAQVTSIEIDPVLVAIARGIIAHAGLSTRVRVWTGHSRLLLPLLMKRRWQERPTAPWFDAMFIDRWGTQYPEDLDFVEKLRLLRPSGALLVADNVLRTAAAHFLWRLSTDKVQQPSGKLQRIFASRTVEVNEVGDASDVDWMSVSVTLRGIPDEQALIREQVPDELEEMPNARVVALWNVDICNVCPSSCVCGRQRQAALFRLRRSRTLCDRRKLCLNLLGLGLHDEDQEDAGRISAFADIDVPYRVEHAPPGYISTDMSQILNRKGNSSFVIMIRTTNYSAGPAVVEAAEASVFFYRPDI